MPSDPFQQHIPRSGWMPVQIGGQSRQQYPTIPINPTLLYRFRRIVATRVSGQEPGDGHRVTGLSG